MKVNTFLIISMQLLCADPVAAAVVASDTASNAAYTNGWQAGDNGGTGFGPWTLTFSGDASRLVHNPHFIDRGPLLGNTLGAPAFALSTSNRNNQLDTSEATRNFSTSLQIGHTFSIDVDGSVLDTGNSSNGNTVQLFGTNGIERFGLFTNSNFNGNNWSTMRDVSTGVPAAGAFHFDFTLVTANTYNLAIRPIGGGTPLFTQTGAQLTGTSNSGINKLVVSNYGTGSTANGTRELFFNNLAITSPAVPGDHNADGTVDAADYVVWRKTDTGNPQGYTDWQAKFGNGIGAGSRLEGASPYPTNVPEPATLVLLTFAAIDWCLARRRSTQKF